MAPMAPMAPTVWSQRVKLSARHLGVSRVEAHLLFFGEKNMEKIMDFGDFHVILMGFSWDFIGFSWDFMWISWDFHVIFMGFPWDFHGLLGASSWDVDFDGDFFRGSWFHGILRGNWIWSRPRRKIGNRNRMGRLDMGYTMVLYGIYNQYLGDNWACMRGVMMGIQASIHWLTPSNTRRYIVQQRSRYSSH